MDRRVLLASILVLLLVPAGLVAGAGLKVTKSTGEKGFGTVIGATGAGNWWAFLQFTTGTVPTGLVSANTTASSPSVVAGNTTSSFGVGPTAGGSGAYVWLFQVAAAAPTSTELKLNFSIVLFGAATHLLLYLETPAAALTTAQLVRLYFPIPASPPSGLPYLSLLEISSVCTSVGTCP